LFSHCIFLLLELLGRTSERVKVGQDGLTNWQKAGLPLER